MTIKNKKTGKKITINKNEIFKNIMGYMAVESLIFFDIWLALINIK